ncbi:MAG TPA: class I SAM-dependent methyltransferase [Gammaproteobacteria bacterium]|nr:class I SAM-dependent methyltransferase [Gammaproteobacteria bacterium]
MDHEKEYVKKLDRIAEDYHSADILDKFIEGACQEYTLEWIFDKVTNKQNILELGYGDGIISDALARKGFGFEILEGSPKVIETAVQALPGNIKIIETLFETYQPDQRYDCVLALHVLEHVDDPVELFSRMASWLSENGSIVVIAPNSNSLHRQLAVKMGLAEELDTLSPRDLVVGHQRVYSHETLRCDVEAAGLKVVEETGFFLKALPNSMMLDYDARLIQALNEISPALPPELLANIGMVVEPV